MSAAQIRFQSDHAPSGANRSAVAANLGAFLYVE
jgi:hypothetical protein